MQHLDTAQQKSLLQCSGSSQCNYLVLYTDHLFSRGYSICHSFNRRGCSVKDRVKDKASLSEYFLLTLVFRCRKKFCIFRSSGKIGQLRLHFSKDTVIQSAFDLFVVRLSVPEKVVVLTTFSGQPSICLPPSKHLPSGNFRKI